MKEPKLDDLMDEPSPFQNRDARNQKQHNWDVLRRFGKAVGGFLTNSVSEINNAISDAGDRMDDIEDRYNQQIAGNTELKEIIDSRKPEGKPAFITLGERLNNMPDNDDVFTDLVVSVDDGVQEPFKSALTLFKRGLNPSAVKIGLIQDVHYTRSVYADYGDAVKRGLVHIQHVGALSDSLDLVVYNGDLAHGRETKSGTINRIGQIINTHELALGSVPSLWTIGNHDDNNVYFEELTAKTQNTLTLRELQQYFKIDKTYGYRDFEEQKLRVITLNTFENPEKYDSAGNIIYSRSYNSVLSSKQLNWFANDALKVPVGYHVLIFTHAPLQGFSQNKPYPNYKNINHDVLLSVIGDFLNAKSSVIDGTNSDYPVSIATTFADSPKGVLIGIIAGHEHHDVAPQIVNGVRLVERTCNIAVNNRQIGTVEEDAFDVVEVDTANRTCKLNRFGSGSSLQFDY